MTVSSPNRSGVPLLPSKVEPLLRTSPEEFRLVSVQLEPVCCHPTGGSHLTNLKAIGEHGGGALNTGGVYRFCDFRLITISGKRYKMAPLLLEGE